MSSAPSHTGFYNQYRLDAGSPADFGTSQWQERSDISWSYVFFSVSSALFLNVEVLVKVLMPAEHGGWWDGAHFASHFIIYLTNWTQCLLAHSAMVSAGLALEHVYRVRKGQWVRSGQ
ncbi:uncharacterized protein LOC119114321 [Pollicipes pollicipes]|uniref:uncharacterized protein LOC119114321 n=1 Tax=Pollicipes pollicipes TaxID=41117 RepID=UPI0018859E5C|nr:uncharacterized protein LOC119114321 [Pollicipes pollicipes]